MRSTMAALVLLLLLLSAAACDESSSSSGSRSSSHSSGSSSGAVSTRPGTNPMSPGSSSSGSFRDGATTQVQPSGSTTKPQTVPSTTTVSVYASSPNWQSTGVSLRAGESISLSASGSVVHWKSRDGSEKQTCGPSGVEGTTNENVYLAPGLRRMALVGKVGSSTFYVGSSTTYQARESGTLYLGINDTVYAGGCADNEGSWTVQIRK